MAVATRKPSAVWLALQEQIELGYVLCIADYACCPTLLQVLLSALPGSSLESSQARLQGAGSTAAAT
jgi:hypothetical protein